LVRELRQREIEKIQVVAKAMKLQQSKQLDSDVQDLIFSIFTENEKMPMIVTDENKKPIIEEGFYKNIPENIVKDSIKLEEYMAKMERNYKPIENIVAEGHKQFIFYDNSELLRNLQYYPYFLGIFILSYLFFSIWFLRVVKKTDEGYVWAGLAKETAHQIGTPLSSMIGWTEIMRMENPESEGVHEISKDIERLKTISERFSKIGSIPELNDLNLSETVQENYDYLKSRISKKVQFQLHMPVEDILVPHNRILMSWVIENLVKNAVDAMKGVGSLNINVFEKNKLIIVEVKDSGSGMTGRQARNAFKPGYSTKKRGWGLGLSLAKRVINEFHKGDLKIAQTEVGKGTTFRIIFKK
jgi:two-component sensor histidine kinase